MESRPRGEREREIPIRNAEQRPVLDQTKQLAGKGNLEPPAMRYVEQLKPFDAQMREGRYPSRTRSAPHYVQKRYREWTMGLLANGGPTSKTLTPEQKVIGGPSPRPIRKPGKAH